MKINQDVINQGRIIRRQGTAIACIGAACLFCFMSITELQADNPVFAILSGVAAVSSGVIALLSIRLGVNQLVLRTTIAVLLGVIFVESTQEKFIYLLLLPVLAPFLFIVMWEAAEAFVWSVATGFLGLLMITFHGHSMTITLTPVMLTLIFVGAIFVAAGFERMWSNVLRSTGGEQQRLEAEIEEKNAIAARNDQLFSDLNSALREVRELTGLIPMCASCKKIRGDEDFWEHVEAYLHKRTQLQFSHGLCPDCSSDALEDIDQHEARARGN